MVASTTGLSHIECKEPLPKVHLQCVPGSLIDISTLNMTLCFLYKLGIRWLFTHYFDRYTIQQP